MYIMLFTGCNDGENFPEQLLLEIYDRIGKVSKIASHNTTAQDHYVTSVLYAYYQVSYYNYNVLCL